MTASHRNRHTLFSLQNKTAMTFILSAGSTQAAEAAILQNASILGNLTKQPLENALLRMQLKVNQLLDYVVKGKKGRARYFLQTNPQILLFLLKSKGIVTDYSGRIIEGTALQMALGAEDVRYHPEEEGMAEMILHYLRNCPEGIEESSAQIREQFPPHWKQRDAERAAADTAALRRVTAAIANSETNADCENALEQFRQHLDSHPKNIIRTGKHANVHLLKEAIRLYKNNFYHFGGANSRKNHLFKCKIIGFIQRLLPAHYAQAYCQGLIHIIEFYDSLRRGPAYFPLDTNPDDRLGHHFSHPYMIPTQYLTRYIKRKSAELDKLISPTSGFRFKLISTRPLSISTR